jgi:hypothetical protein
MTTAVTIPPDLIRPALELCLEFGLRPSAALLDTAGDLLLARAKEVQLDQLYENMKARFELKQAADAAAKEREEKAARRKAALEAWAARKPWRVVPT